MVVNKNAYLDAMGICRWKLAAANTPQFTILIDKQALDLDHPILRTVLELMAWPIEQCVFTEQAGKAAQIVWDLRAPKPETQLLRRVHRQQKAQVAQLVSLPLADLERSGAEKKALWEQIWRLQQDTAQNKAAEQ